MLSPAVRPHERFSCGRVGPLYAMMDRGSTTAVMPPSLATPPMSFSLHSPCSALKCTSQLARFQPLSAVSSLNLLSSSLPRDVSRFALRV